MITAEELEIVAETLEEFIKQRGWETKQIFFDNQLMTALQLLEEVKRGTSTGIKFAEIVIDKGLEYAFTERKSTIFDSLAVKVLELEGQVLYGYFSMPPVVFTPRQMALEILYRTNRGKKYVKDFLKATMERRVFQVG